MHVLTPSVRVRVPGMYQHDLSESALGERLAEVIEECVNCGGVDLNTASAYLLKVRGATIEYAYVYIRIYIYIYKYIDHLHTLLF